jgi:hypothetical protein
MIKVTIGESKTQEKPFPKLMKSNLSGDLCLVFENESKDGYIGLNLTGKHAGIVGFRFVAKNCTDYNEPITIQNA